MSKKEENALPAASAPLIVAELENNPAADDLKSLHELATSFRVPSWQQAALVRFMGWAPGKLVSESDYAQALDELTARRMGGGRKE